VDATVHVPAPHSDDVSKKAIMVENDHLQVKAAPETGGALASSNHVTQKTGYIGYFQKNHGGWPEELWCSRPASPVRMEAIAHLT